MIFLYFLIWPLVASINIGFFRREGNADDTNKAKLIDLYLKDLTADIEKINIVECEYSNTQDKAEESIKNCFKNKFKDNTPIIFGFCDNYILNYSSEFLYNYSSYMWCLNTYSSGLCEKNFIMGSSVIPPMHSCIY